MLHQRYKDIAFWGIAKATLPNYYMRRYVTGVRSGNGTRHLHLGCGPKYLPGFVNVDANLFNKLDVWLDVRNGLPFPASSVDSIYSTHMFEHFYPDELQLLLRECQRVLKPGGGMRLIVPNLASAISAYAQRHIDWFDASFPRHFDSLGGDFRILCSVTASTGPRSILPTWMRCCGGLVSAKLRNQGRERAAYTRAEYLLMSPAICAIFHIRSTSKHLSKCILSDHCKGIGFEALSAHQRDTDGCGSSTWMKPCFAGTRRASRGGPLVQVAEMHETLQRDAGQLRRQLEWVAQRFTLISPKIFFALWERPETLADRAKPAVLFTFDDGRASNYTVAAPLLESMGARGLFFVVPEFIGLTGQEARDFYYSRIDVRGTAPSESAEEWTPMNPAQLADLAQRGHAIGNHTLSHASLAGLSRSDLERQIAAGADKISRWTQRDVEAFAWPYAWNAIDRDAWDAILKRATVFVFLLAPARLTVRRTRRT